MALLTCTHCGRELPAGADRCPEDGTEVTSVDQLWNDTTAKQSPSRSSLSPGSLSGQKLGDFLVGEQLGVGGMGEVYAGEQPMIGKKVAIKVLKAQVAADPENVRRMLAEARAVNAIRHRGIVDIFTFGTLPDGRPYLVMEYLEGSSLETILRKRRLLPPVEVAELLEEICDALHAAHGKGIVHRDLKPGNVFLVTDPTTRTRYLKLLDFGLAKAAELPVAGGARTRVGTVLGTPDYMAPEQARAIEITPRTDLYALGVMAFEMLTGELPFKAPSINELISKHVSEPAPKVSSRGIDLPKGLDALVFRMMAKEPKDRPHSARAVGQELERMHRAFRQKATISLGDIAEQLKQKVLEAPPKLRGDAKRTEVEMAPAVIVDGLTRTSTELDAEPAKTAIGAPIGPIASWKLAAVGGTVAAVLAAIIGWLVLR